MPISVRGPATGSAVDADLALARREQARQDQHEGRLAAAGRADQRHELALADMQVGRPEGMDGILAVAEDFCHAPYVDRRTHATPRPLPPGGERRSRLPTTLQTAPCEAWASQRHTVPPPKGQNKPPRERCSRKAERDLATGSLPLKGGGQEGVGAACDALRIHPPRRRTCVVQAGRVRTAPTIGRPKRCWSMKIHRASCGTTDPLLSSPFQGEGPCGTASTHLHPSEFALRIPAT